MRNLPKGYRFVPRHDELIQDYLLRKVRGNPLPCNAVVECDLYGDKLPWQICKERRTSKLYAFTQRRKLSCKKKNSQTFSCGRWHEKARKMNIFDRTRKEVIGLKRQFTFRPATASSLTCGNHGKWLMNQFSLAGSSLGKENKYPDYVLCEVYQKKRHDNKEEEEEEDGADYDVADAEIISNDDTETLSNENQEVKANMSICTADFSDAFTSWQPAPNHSTNHEAFTSWRHAAPVLSTNVVDMKTSIEGFSDALTSWQSEPVYSSDSTDMPSSIAAFSAPVPSNFANMASSTEAFSDILTSWQIAPAPSNFGDKATCTEAFRNVLTSWQPAQPVHSTNFAESREWFEHFLSTQIDIFEGHDPATGRHGQDDEAFTVSQPAPVPSSDFSESEEVTESEKLAQTDILKAMILYRGRDDSWTGKIVGNHFQVR